MRIMMLTDLYPPVIGGLELHVRNLAAGLVADGHRVAVVTQAHPDAPPFEVEAGGVRVHRIRGTLQRATALFSDEGRRFAPPFPDPEATAALRRIVATERPEIVHAHNWLVHSFLPLKRWSGAKLVVSLHDYSLACARKDLTYRGAPCDGPAPRKCFSCGIAHYGAAKGAMVVGANVLTGAAERALVDRFLPVSAAVARGNGLIGGRWPVEIVPNFIPNAAAEGGGDLSRYTDLLPAGPFLLFVGALIPAKGIATLLDAYAGLADAPPLVLIGATWPNSPKRFPPNVLALHDWPHAAVMAAWRRSLFGVVPSVWGEPCPTVALEAMAAGKALIASRIGGLPEIVADGQTGTLVAPGDVASWRAALADLIAEPSRADRYGAAGRERVRERFVASAVIPRIAGVYRQLLSAPARRAVAAPATGD